MYSKFGTRVQIMCNYASQCCYVYQTDDVNQSTTTKKYILLNSGTNGLHFNPKLSRNQPTYVRYCKFQFVTP